MNNEMSIEKNGEVTLFNIKYGRGMDALEMAMTESIYNLLSMNVEKKEIVIYMPLLIQGFFLSNAQHNRLNELAGKHKNSGWTRLDKFLDVTVLPGYESGVVVIAWENGERYNVEPIRITWKIEKDGEN